jgi:GNAT superfamily N-acetyltransferase
MLSVQPLQTRDPEVALEVQAVFALAQQQEAVQIGLAPADTPPGRSLGDVMASTDFHLGARDGPHLVGVLAVGPDDEAGQVAISALVVHPAHQRRGIGRALLREALARGAGLGFCVTASARNPAALALYASASFVAYRHGALGPQALPMVKLRRPAA